MYKLFYITLHLRYIYSYYIYITGLSVPLPPQVPHPPATLPVTQAQIPPMMIPAPLHHPHHLHLTVILLHHLRQAVLNLKKNLKERRRRRRRNRESNSLIISCHGQK